MISTMVPIAHNTASFVRSAAMRRITPKAIIGLVTFLAATGRPSGSLSTRSDRRGSYSAVELPDFVWEETWGGLTVTGDAEVQKRTALAAGGTRRKHRRPCYPASQDQPHRRRATHTAARQHLRGREAQRPPVRQVRFDAAQLVRITDAEFVAQDIGAGVDVGSSLTQRAARGCVRRPRRRADAARRR
jgi:hypothetical protein